MKKILFCSHNKNKTKEIKAKLSNNYEIFDLNDINFTDEIIENGKTFHENAKIKVDAIVNQNSFDYIFGDDSGLEVTSLNNEPGVFSARYASDQKNDEDNMNKLIENIKDKVNKNARFKTVICLKTANDHMFFEGILDGVIITDKRGSNGFGYDPIFIPEGFEITLAEMTLEEKNKISHRAIAVQNLLAYLNA